MTKYGIDRPSAAVRILKSAVSLFAADLTAKLSSAFLSIAIIRRLHTDEYGAYSAILGFLLIGSLLAEFGLSQVLIREIAQNKAKGAELFTGAVLAVLPMGALAASGSIIVALLMGYPSTLTLILAFATVTIFMNALILLSGAVLRAFEQMGVLSFINALFSISSASCGIVWLQNGARLPELIVLLVTTTAFNAAVLLIYILKRLVTFDFDGASKVKIGLIKEAIPIAILGLCAVVLQRFDVLLLTNTAGMSAVGIYSSAITIIEALGIFIQSILGAAFPYVAVSWQDAPMRAAHNYERLLRYFVIVGMPVTVGVYLLSDRVVLLLFKPEYIESATCLKILIWCFMLNSIAGPAGMLLIITKIYLRRFIPAALMITCISIFLNIVLTPTYGYLAACGIALFVSFLLFVVKIRAMVDILPSQPRWFKVCWRSMTGAAVMGATVWWLRKLAFGELIIAGVLTYFVTIALLGELTEEVQLASRLMNRMKA